MRNTNLKKNNIFLFQNMINWAFIYVYKKIITEEEKKKSIYKIIMLLLNITKISYQNSVAFTIIYIYLFLLFKKNGQR